MEKRYTVRQAVTMTGVKSYVLRYWEEELDLRIGRNELGHRYYTPFDIQLFLKINELKNRGLQLKAIRTLIPQEARNTYPSDLAKTGSEILEGEAVEIEDIPVGTPEEAAEDMFMEKQKTSKEHREDDKKILEFQEILERLEPDFKVFYFEKEECTYEELSEEQKEEEKQNIMNGFHFANKVVETGDCDLLVLDEVLGLVDLGILTIQDIYRLIEKCGTQVSLIMTGKYISKELLQHIDEVSEINCIKTISA